MTSTANQSSVHQGDLNIHTENIFPIIKKWLYTDHEIFVRELVSNSFDAITKLLKINTHEKLGLSITPLINITVDKDKKTVTISDNGLGMDKDDIEKYINQIAFSGAEDFVKKYKDKEEKQQIIGHFGLGFYSSFMVSDTVEIVSLSYKKGAKAVKWRCDGSTKYSLEETKKEQIGTDIILHINEESLDYLEELRLKELVRKYANFLPVEIQVNGEKSNEEAPLWIKSPTELKDEDYKAFYSKLFPFDQEPLFWIHLNVDYPFNLKGILYFPKLVHELDSQKGNVKLFCQQVFVSDNAKEVVPEFLTLLRGAIDCPEIPLNVSRSSLQNDPYVQKISKHIVKKIADKLIQLHKKDYANFKVFWDDINPFIKFGMMNDNDFYEKVKDIVIFKSSNDDMTTIADYLERNKGKIDNKVLYSNDPEAQASYIDLCKEQGLEVIYLNHIIDTHYIQFLESKLTDVKFESVDADLTDHLVDKTKSDTKSTEKETQESETLESLFKKVIKSESVKIKVEPLKSESVSGMILQSEQMKRLKQMSAMMKGAQLPEFDDFTFVINAESPVIKSILNLSKTKENNAVVNVLCRQVYDLAQLSQKQFSGDEMKAFIARSNDLLTKIH